MIITNLKNQRFKTVNIYAKVWILQKVLFMTCDDNEQFSNSNAKEKLHYRSRALKECHRRESIRSYLNILLKKTWKVTLQQTFMINGMTSISLLMKQYCICIFISQWDVHYYYDFVSQINDLVFRTFDVLSRYNDFYIRRTTYYLILITYHLVITTEYTVRIVCMN